jgi:hypothetical protein
MDVKFFMVERSKVKHSKVPRACYYSKTHAYYVLELAMAVYIKDAIIIKLYHFDNVDLFDSDSEYYLEEYSRYKTGQGFLCSKHFLYNQDRFIFILDCFIARYSVFFLYHSQNLLLSQFFSNKAGKMVYNIDTNCFNFQAVRMRSKIVEEVKKRIQCSHHFSQEENCQNRLADCAVHTVITMLSLRLPEISENEITCFIPLYKLQREIPSPHLNLIPGGMESDTDDDDLIISNDDDDDDDDHIAMKRNEEFFNVRYYEQNNEGGSDVPDSVG